jgi:hypothetical protein
VIKNSYKTFSLIRREKRGAFPVIAAMTFVSVILGSCGPLGTPLRPVGPAPKAKPTVKDSAQEQLERFNIFLDRA